MLTEQEKKQWLQLFLSENVGPIAFHDLIAYCQTAQAALEYIARSGQKFKRPIRLASMEKVEQLLEEAAKNNVQILFHGEEGYPCIIEDISGIPPILFACGQLSLLQNIDKNKGVGMVGTRTASLNAQELTAKIAKELAEQDYIIVSGMAKGIDTAAHQGALSNTNGKGGTIAVLGTSVNVCYPLENKNLFEEIKERGLLLSEIPFGETVSLGSFPRRNRIISALSAGVVVVEAGLNSGSLHTARFALEQGKALFAIPGSPTDKRNLGVNNLIKEGAYLVNDTTDITRKLNQSVPYLIMHEPKQQSLFTTPCNQSEAERDKFKEEIKSLLSPEGVEIDSIIQATRLPTATVRMILTEMELNEEVQRLMGDKVALLYKG